MPLPLLMNHASSRAEWKCRSVLCVSGGISSWASTSPSVRTPRVAYASRPSRPSSTGSSARLRMVGGRSGVGSGRSSGPSSASASNGCALSEGVHSGPSQNWPVLGR